MKMSEEELRDELDIEWRAISKTISMYSDILSGHVGRRDYLLAWIDLRDMRSSVLKRFQRISAMRSLLSEIEEVKKR